MTKVLQGIQKSGPFDALDQFYRKTKMLEWPQHKGQHRSPMHLNGETVKMSFKGKVLQELPGNGQ